MQLLRSSNLENPGYNYEVNSSFLCNLADQFGTVGPYVLRAA